MLKKFIPLMILCCALALPVQGELKENELDWYKNKFREKVLNDNPGRESEIRKSLEGMVKVGGAGVKLIDKFGLFLYDSRRNNLVLEKVKFFRDGSSSIFIISLRDESDEQLYSLFLEYVYSSSRGTFSLGEIYFSKVFEEKMTSVREFFSAD